MKPFEFWDMSPNDFNALCEGYENKRRAEIDLIRLHAYIIVSPYMDKGSTYEGFKRKSGWLYSWEKQDGLLTKEEIATIDVEAIKRNHARILEQAKSKKNGSR